MIENKLSFMNRIASFPFRTRVAIELAYVLTKDGMRNQVRKTGDRAFEHPRAVALIIMDEFKILNPLYLVVALCHDNAEDCKYLTPGFLEQVFGSFPGLSMTGSCVNILTKKKNVDIEQYFNGIKALSVTAFVKGCDRLHNLRTLPDDPVFIKKQIRETEKYVIPMLVLWNLHPEFAELEAKIRAQIQVLKKKLKK